MKTTITVEKRNKKGVYARELGKWLNYSKFYKGNELEIGKIYSVELDGDFIMNAAPIEIKKDTSERPTRKENSLINSPVYLSLKLAVELHTGKQVEPQKVIQTARMFKKYLEEL